MHVSSIRVIGIGKAEFADHGRSKLNDEGAFGRLLLLAARWRSVNRQMGRGRHLI